MKRTLIIAIVLLSSSVFAAQASDENYTQTMPATSRADTSGSAASTETLTIQGCLARAGYGDFVLTDAAGLRYYINGDRRKLTNMVGHEVRIAGIVSPSRNPSTPGAISAASSPDGVSPHMTVITVRTIADNCERSSTGR